MIALANPQNSELTVFETDIDRANQIIAEWAKIARSIARQCKWRERGVCLATCQGLAVCDTTGLPLAEEAP